MKNDTPNKQPEWWGKSAPLQPVFDAAKRGMSLVAPRVPERRLREWGLWKAQPTGMDDATDLDRTLAPKLGEIDMYTRVLLPGEAFCATAGGTCTGGNPPEAAEEFKRDLLALAMDERINARLVCVLDPARSLRFKPFVQVDPSGRDATVMRLPANLVEELEACYRAAKGFGKRRKRRKR